MSSADSSDRGKGRTSCRRPHLSPLDGLESFRVSSLLTNGQHSIEKGPKLAIVPNLMSHRLPLGSNLVLSAPATSPTCVLHASQLSDAAACDRGASGSPAVGASDVAAATAKLSIGALRGDLASALLARARRVAFDRFRPRNSPAVPRPSALAWVHVAASNLKVVRSVELKRRPRLHPRQPLSSVPPSGSLSWLFCPLRVSDCSSTDVALVPIDRREPLLSSKPLPVPWPLLWVVSATRLGQLPPWVPRRDRIPICDDQGRPSLTPPSACSPEAAP